MPSSESSLFISPHRLILKTCGTTLNLLGLPRILAIARAHAQLPEVYRLFYSRKSFMFPDRQQGPHKEWKDEVQFLDAIFSNGSAYTVGRVNGDHWLLYMTGPAGESPALASPYEASADLPAENGDGPTPSKPPVQAHPISPEHDYTIEILMTHLSSEARDPFFTPASVDDASASSHATDLSSAIGISGLFPEHATQLDAYSFTPCGYSSNALIKWGPGESAADTGAHEGYYTIHVTPEEGWSYASFECNVPLAPARATGSGNQPASPDDMPDLRTLVRRVVRIFRPGTITLTLFISSVDNDGEDVNGESPVEAAQRAFRAALTEPLGLGEGESLPKEQRKRVYKRTDKINYEFGGYDLAFASFELCS
jgi:S-adenosylmethionine decarboxylase